MAKQFRIFSVEFKARKTKLTLEMLTSTVIAKDTLICFGYVRSSLPTIQIDNIANTILKYVINDNFGFIHNKRYTEVRNQLDSHSHIICNMKSIIEHNMSTVIFKPFLSSLLDIENSLSTIKLMQLNISICKLPQKCKLTRLGINSYDLEFGLLCIPKQSILDLKYPNDKQHKLGCRDFGNSPLSKLLSNNSSKVVKNKNKSRNKNVNSDPKYDYRIKSDKYLNEFENIFSNKIKHFAMETCRLGLFYRNISTAMTTDGNRIFETKSSEIDLNMFNCIKSIYIGCVKTAKAYNCYFKDNNSDRQKPKDKFIYHFKQKYDARYCLEINDFVQIAVKLDKNSNGKKRYKVYFGKGTQNGNENATNVSNFTRNFENTSDFLDSCDCDVELDFEQYDYLFALGSARCSCDKEHSVAFEICLRKY